MNNELRRLTDEDLKSPASIYIADLQAQVKRLTQELATKTGVLIDARKLGRDRLRAAYAERDEAYRQLAAVVEVGEAVSRFCYGLPTPCSGWRGSDATT